MIKKIVNFFILYFLLPAISWGSGVSQPSNYNPAAVSITGGTINGVTLSVNGATLTGSSINTTAITNSTYAGSSFTLSGTNSYTAIGTTALTIHATPSYVSACGTGTTITRFNGTAAFSVNIATTSAATTCTLALSSLASTGWICNAANTTIAGVPTPFVYIVLSSGVTNVVVRKYDMAGIATAFATNESFDVFCVGY